jgi:hypothetical protein
MFIDKYLIPVMRFVLIFGIPILLFGIGIFFMIKIFFMPAFSSGRKRQKSTETVKVLGKREEVLMNQSGIVTLYFVTFDLGNDILELMVPKSYYKDLNYGDKGNLSHTGDRFNGFTVTNKSGDKTDGATAIVGDTMRSSLNEISQKKREN